MPRERAIRHAGDDAIAAPSGRESPGGVLAALLQPEIPSALLLGVARDAADDPPAPAGCGVDEQGDLRAFAREHR